MRTARERVPETSAVTRGGACAGNKYREPGAGSREPGAGSREPGAGSREPGAGILHRRAPPAARDFPRRAPPARTAPSPRAPHRSSPCRASRAIARRHPRPLAVIPAKAGIHACGHHAARASTSAPRARASSVALNACAQPTTSYLTRRSATLPPPAADPHRITWKPHHQTTCMRSGLERGAAVNRPAVPMVAAALPVSVFVVGEVRTDGTNTDLGNSERSNPRDHCCPNTVGSAP